MKFGLLFLGVAALCCADSLPVTYSCNTANCAFPDGMQAIIGTVTVDQSGGSYSIQETAQINPQLQAVNDLGSTPFSFAGDVSWSDPLTLPALPPGSTYHLAMTSWGGNVANGEYGPSDLGNGNYIGVEIDGTPFTGACDYNVPFCRPTFDGTLPPGSTVTLVGNLTFGFDSAEYQPGLPLGPSVNGWDLESSISIDDPPAASSTAAPEPSTYWAMLAGFGFLAFMKWVWPGIVYRKNGHRRTGSEGNPA